MCTAFKGAGGNGKIMKISAAKGFSLLELMMVLVIIAILAAVAAPSMGGWLAKRDLNSASRTLFSHMQLARSQAVKGNEIVRICFDTGSSPNSYIILADTSGIVVPKTELPSDDLSFTSVNFVGIGAMSSNSTGFDGRGLALQSGSVTVESSAAPESDKDRTITLSLGGSTSVTP